MPTLPEYLPELRPDSTSTVDPGTAERIRVLNEAICADPERYLHVIASLGDIGILGADVQPGELEAARADEEAAQLVASYLDDRLEREAEFDTATQAALDADDGYASRFAAVQGATSKVYRTGVMGSRVLPNLDANRLRADLSRYRLAFYIARVSRFRGEGTAVAVAS